MTVLVSKEYVMPQIM